ncbi:MAG: cysteine desulfurase family protein [Lachnospiraceae bacterium]
MKEIYFDNAATTVVSPRAAETVLRVMTEDYGNPSSLHQKGVVAENYIKNAAKAIAGTMGVSTNDIVFTSGGTEANNQALFGAARANARSGRKILTTAMEHPAVAEVLKALGAEGFEVVTVPVDGHGRLDLAFMERELTPDVILVSTMYVNNEIGAVVPVAEVGKLIKSRCPNAAYHVDAIQAYGKYRIYPKELGIDLLSVSGHKLHGPKGTGFLYKSERVKCKPLLYGGGQQGGLRSGTENVPGIAGLGVAAEEAYGQLSERVEQMRLLRKRMIEGLEVLPEVIVHGMPGDEGAPHIVNAAFLGVGAEVLQHSLEDHGIYVSAGSACSSHKRAGSPTLTAIGATKEEMSSSVRFSFSARNTAEEVDEALTVLSGLLPMLRRYRRR